jgi:ribosome-associated protein
MTVQEKLDLITHTIDDMKAEDIQVLDVREKTSVADYFVVCSASNERLLSAIADRVDEKLREHKERPLRREGGKNGWILHDYGDIILHVMRDEQRQFYDLETLWNTMQPNPDVH